MYKLLVLDFDDTLLKSDLSISEANKEAIKQAKEQGVHVLFCSGRSSESMRPYIEMMDIHDEDDYFVSFNGARIDRVTGETVFNKGIDQPLLSELIDLAEEYNITLQLYQDHMYAASENAIIKEYVGLTSSTVEIVDDLRVLTNSTKVLFNCKDIPLLEKIQTIIKEKHGDKVNVFFSKPTYLEVLNKEANKGLAVEYMAKELGVEQSEIIAVGDSFNDSYMIRYAGLGVAVANAREEVKDIADYITESDHDHDAVAEVVQRFILK